MGKTYKGITLKFGADTKSLGQAVKNMEANLRSFDAELKDINNSLKFKPDSAVLMSQKMQVLEKAISETSKKLHELESVQAEVDREFQNGKIDEEVYRSFQREIEKTRAKLQQLGREKDRVSELGKSFDAAADSAENLNSELRQTGNQAVQQFSDAFGNLKSEVKKTMDDIVQLGTKAFAAISAAVAAALAGASKVGADFEEAMSQVAATMAIDVSSDDYKTLSDFAKQMGATTKFTASEAAEALNYLALAGLDTEEMLQTLPSVLNLAAAGGMDLASASDMVTDSMLALGVATSQTEVFADKMAKTSQKTNTNIAQLGEGILTIGGTAKSLKGGVTELNVALGILADNGIKASDGGTLLRNILTDITAPTEKAAAKLKELGVEIYDSENNMRSLNDIFYDFGQAIKNLNDADRADAVNAIFDARNKRGVEALISGAGDRFNELTGYLNNCTGAAERMAETMSDNLKGSLTILKSGLEACGITVYESLEAPFKKAVNTAISEVSKLNGSMSEGELRSSVKKIADGFSELTEKVIDFTVNNAVPAAIKSLEWIADNGALIKSTLIGIGTAMLTFKALSFIEKASLALQAYKAAAQAAASGQALLNSVMAVNPWVLVGTAVLSATAFVKSYIPAITEAKDITADYRKELENAKQSSESARQNDEAQILILEKKINKYNKLRAELKDNSEVSEEFKNLAEELQQELGDSVQVISKTTGAYNELGTAAKKALQDMRANAEFNARKSLYEAEAAQLVELQDKIAEARNEYSKAMQDYRDEGLTNDDISERGLDERIRKKLGLSELEQQLQTVKSEMAEFESYASDYYSNTESVASESSSTASSAAAETVSKIVSVSEVFSQASEDIENYRKSIDSIKSSSEKISAALKEQSENGYLSNDTVLSLIDSGYGLALQWDSESGKCTLLKSKIDELAKAKYTKIKADLSEKEINLKSKYEEETAALEKLRKSINSAADAQLYKSRTEALENYKNELSSLESYNKILDSIFNGFDEKISVESEVTADEQSVTDTVDYYKQAFEDEKDALDHALAMNEISVTDYYLSLNNLLQSYYADKSEYLDEYQKYSETVYKGLLDAKKQQLQNEKNLLRSNNEERQKEYDISKAIIDLENARNQKNQRVYYEEKGWVWEENKKDVSDAQNKLNDLIAEKQIDSIERLIDVIDMVSSGGIQLTPSQTQSLYSGNFDIQSVADSIYSAGNSLEQSISSMKPVSQALTINVDSITTNNAEDFVSQLNSLMSDAKMKIILDS